MKLFHKKRFQLLKGTRFSKYLTYAFGEILLVIIGILIALGINNWNNNRQLANINNELTKKVIIQLQRDIQKTKAFQKDLDTIQNIYLKALDRDYDSLKTGLDYSISTLLYDVYDLPLDQTTINLIDNAALDNSEKSKELIALSSTYKLYAKNFNDIENIIYEKMTSNLTEIEKTQDWYVELITDYKCKDDCIRYLNSNKFKSQIASLRFLYVNLYGDIVYGFENDLAGFKSRLEHL
ncbi:hypothetical protein [Psychroserpens damuponensis]|uniref:hypothetical protein n=1 Tax=Psychroserpens damuponensis TaxID=943936 RepID=UPI0006941CA4|nr:hypothetical protein [Psychroserpens damuponensis]